MHHFLCSLHESTLATDLTGQNQIDAASCVGYGACVAYCPNASAMLFVSAKVSQLTLLP
jgi:succinate dehydrogenase / fumarate reductase iron-sulfur subunit